MLLPPIQAWKPVIRDFTKYCIVGSIGVAISWSCLYFFTEYAGLWYMHSSVVSLCFTTAWNFSAHRHWTFNGRRKQ